MRIDTGNRIGNADTLVESVKSNGEELKKSAEIAITSIWSANQEWFVTSKGKSKKGSENVGEDKKAEPRRESYSHAGVVNSSAYVGATDLSDSSDPLIGLGQEELGRTCSLKIEKLIGTSFVLLAIASSMRQVISQELTELQMGKGRSGLEAAHAALMPGAYVHTKKSTMIEAIRIGVRSICEVVEVAYRDRGAKNDPKDFEKTLRCYSGLGEVLPLNGGNQRVIDFRQTIGMILSGDCGEEYDGVFVEVYKLVDELVEEDLGEFLEGENLIGGIFFQYSLNSTDDLPSAFNQILDQVVERWMRPQIWALVNKCAMGSISLDRGAELFLVDLETSIARVRVSLEAYKVYFMGKAVLEEKLKKSLEKLKVEAMMEGEVHDFREVVIEFTGYVAQMYQLQNKLNSVVNIELDAEDLSALTKKESTLETADAVNGGGFKHEPIDAGTAPKIPYFQVQVEACLNHVGYMISKVSGLSVVLRKNFDPQVKYERKESRNKEEESEFEEKLKLWNVLSTIDPDYDTGGLKGLIEGLFPGEYEEGKAACGMWVKVRKECAELFKDREFNEKVLRPRSTGKIVSEALLKKSSVQVIMHLLIDRYLLNGADELENIKFINQQISNQYRNTLGRTGTVISALFDGSLGLEVNIPIILEEVDASQMKRASGQCTVPKSVKGNFVVREIMNKYKTFQKNSLENKKHMIAPEVEIKSVVESFSVEILKRKERFREAHLEVEVKLLGCNQSNLVALFEVLEEMRGEGYELMGARGEASIEKMREAIGVCMNAHEEGLRGLVEYLEEDAQDQLAMATILARLDLRKIIMQYLEKVEQAGGMSSSQKKELQDVMENSRFDQCLVKGMFFQKFSKWLFPSSEEVKKEGSRIVYKKGREESLGRTYRHIIDFMAHVGFEIDLSEFYDGGSKLVEKWVEGGSIAGVGGMSDLELVSYIESLCDEGLELYRTSLDGIISKASGSDHMKYLLTSEMKDSGSLKVRRMRVKKMQSEEIALYAVSQMLGNRIEEVKLERRKGMKAPNGDSSNEPVLHLLEDGDELTSLGYSEGTGRRFKEELNKVLIGVHGVEKVGVSLLAYLRN